MTEGRLIIAEDKGHSLFPCISQLGKLRGGFIRTHSEVPAGLRDNDLVILLCGYDCSVDFCGRWYRVLRRKPPLSFILFRPILMSGDRNGAYCHLQILAGSDYPNTLERFSVLADSLAQMGIGALIDDYLPYPPLGKVAKIQREIIVREGVDMNRKHLAAMINWSISHLSSAFMKYVGISLDEYARKVKFCSALRKAVGTDKQIKEIAYETRYADPLYFGKAFKRHFGISPVKLRGPLFAKGPTQTLYDHT